MADDFLFYQGFLSAIRNKIRHKATLVNTVTDLLGIDKDAVYRRLRGEVGFSFTEMAIIARSMGISLDVIAGIENEQSRPTKINFSRQVNPTELDYEMFEGHVNLLKSIKDESDTKIMEAGIIFSHYLYHDYEHITRFLLYRWNFSSSFGNAIPFHEITIPERLRFLQKETCKYARHIKSTHYVFDSMMFQRFVLNVKYLEKIRFLKVEDVALIKNDMKAFIENLENIAVKGKHEETGNEVSIFISDIHVDTNYSCLKCKNIQLTLFKTFILNAVVSLDEKVYHETSSWIRSLQRLSTLISVSGEKVRANFFDTQRKIIETL